MRHHVDIAFGSDETKTAFEKFAGQFEFFGVHEFILGRSEIFLADEAAMKRYNEVLAQFTKRDDTIDELRPLLHHPNPKVRLLAIMSIYDKGAASVLSDINDLVKDETPTYPDPPLDLGKLQISGLGPNPEPKTVGAAAVDVVRAYIDPEADSMALDEELKPGRLFPEPDKTFENDWTRMVISTGYLRYFCCAMCAQPNAALPFPKMRLRRSKNSAPKLTSSRPNSDIQSSRD